MKFWSKNESADSRNSPSILGRRRPQLYGNVQNKDLRGGRQKSAFSYYSRRSYNPLNTGRRDPSDIAESRMSAGNPTLLGRRNLLISVLFFLLLPPAVYFVSLGNQPKIVLLKDKTTAYFLQQPIVYQRAAERSFGRSLFNNNKLTVDTASVRLDLLKNFPEIKNTSVVLPVFGHQPQVYIEPYKPSFVMTTSGNAFLLDATGRALSLASQIPDLDKFNVPTIQDHTGTQVQLGNRALPSTTVTFTESVLAALKAEGVSTSSIVLPNAYELDVYIESNTYYIKFNIQGDPLQQSGTFLAVKQRIDGVHIKPGQYVDVRVPERAYYK